LYADAKAGHDIKKYATSGAEDKKMAQSTKNKKFNAHDSPNRSPDRTVGLSVK
jgi:hypothetical protein